MNLPNALTVLRIFLVPVLVVVLLTRARTDEGLLPGRRRSSAWPSSPTTSTATSPAGATRSRGSGILLDPLADKLLTAAAFLSLVEMDAVPAWMVMIILGREFAVTGLRNVAAGRGMLIPASALGKGKMVAQVVAIFLLLLRPRATRSCSRRPWPRCGWWWCWPSSPAIDYFRTFWREVCRPGRGRCPARRSRRSERNRPG